MSSAQYITPPIQTDAQDALNDAFAEMQVNIPGWTPSNGQLDVWILQAVAALGAAARDVAGNVMTAIFRYFGASLVNLPPIDAVPAQAFSTWTMIDALGHTIPAGTQVALPDAAGNLIPFETIQDIVVLAGNVVTTAGQVQLQAINAGAAGDLLGGVGSAVTILDPLVFVSGAVLTGASSGGTDAETDEAYLGRLVGQLQLMAPRPIVPRDFALISRQIDTAYRTVVLDLYNPLHNLLSLNDASLETSVAGYTGTNAALAQTAVQAQDGTKSLQMTAASAADMSASLIQADEVAVTPGDTITAIASFRTAVTARACKVGIAWYTAGNALIGTVYGATSNDSAVGWTSVGVTSVAPATAAFARIVPFVTAPANAEVHYVDELSIRRASALTDWVPGGTAETGNAKYTTISSVDVNGAAVSAGTKTDQLATLQADREINFVPAAIDPIFLLLDVTYNIKALAGYDHAALQAAINTAITGYLSPVTWGNQQNDVRAWNVVPTVRYLELAQVINNVVGVDYIITLTLGYHGAAQAAADLTLGQVGNTLPTASTITPTIS